MQNLLIKMTNPISQQVLTHYKIVSYKIEVSRPDLDKDGFIEIWVAKTCLNSAGIWDEPFSEGIRVFIDDQVEYDDFMSMAIRSGELGTSLTTAIHKWLINNNYLDGKSIDVG